MTYKDQREGAVRKQWDIVDFLFLINFVDSVHYTKKL